MKQKLNVGVIGLGPRGMGLLKENMLEMKDIAVVAVCDAYEDRAKAAQEKVQEKQGILPFCTQDYRQVLAMPEVDAVVISAAWEAHVTIATEAMRAGKYTGLEVGGAYCVEDCWKLVRTYEETGVPCMMLENCCYGRTEPMVLNMVKQGLFGEVVHCDGGYHHDLRQEIADGVKNRHYRLQNYLHRNCENYPTHELGPIAKVLGINRGNRMLSLSACASKAAGLSAYVARQRPEDETLAGARFAQGDIVKTTIRCANGETICLTLDTTLPRAYSRGFCVRGTRAAYEENTNSLFIDGVHNEYDYKWREQWDNAKEYAETYDHPLWKEYQKGEIKAGHDGIDWLVLRAFFESAKRGTQPPIDVYDAASWMCITTLSEDSIACGGAPVPVPDFTCGQWLVRTDVTRGKYCLDEVCEEPDVDIF